MLNKLLVPLASGVGALATLWTTFVVSQESVDWIGGAALDTATSLVSNLAKLLPVLVPVLVVAFIIGLVIGIIRKR